MTEEIQFHLDREIEEKVKAGMAPEAARRAAVRAMGAIENSKEQCRDLHGERRLVLGVGRVVQDLRFALRLFRKHPAPVGIAIGGLALAIGVATAVFTVVDVSLLRPYGMDDPASVVSVTRPGVPGWVGWPYGQFLRMRTGTRLAVVEAALPRQARVNPTRTDDASPTHRVLFVSGGYLSMLGGRPSLGRSLDAADDVSSAPAVAVISDRLWRTAFNGDLHVIGRTVWVNDAPATVVGVLQPRFTGPVTEPVAVWATFAAFDDLHMGSAITAEAGASVEVIARLSPGTARRAVEDNLTAIVSQPGTAGSPRADGRRLPRVQVYRAASPISGPAGGDTYVGLACILGIVGLILALACANTANLLMASAVTRRREVGVRLAMGATRGRLVGQLITESLLLGLIAGGVGFVLAFWLIPVFGRMIELSPEVTLVPDARVLAFTISVALVSGLGAGLAPARYGARGHVLVALHAQNGSGGHAAIPSRLRTSFVGFQATVSTLLLVVAALLTRSAALTTRIDLGFDADRLVVVSFEPLRKGLDSAAFLRTALMAVREVPSAERASIVEFEPFGSSRSVDRFTYEGRSVPTSGSAIRIPSSSRRPACASCAAGRSRPRKCHMKRRSPSSATHWRACSSARPIQSDSRSRPCLGRCRATRRRPPSSASSPTRCWMDRRASATAQSTDRSGGTRNRRTPTGASGFRSA